MSKELVIGSNRHETKVAVLEEDQLVEVYFQRANEYSLAGSIHKGRVTRVLPGMQSAFVDLGLERDTFLYVSDFFEENEDIEPLGDDKPVRQDSRPESRAEGRNDRRDRGSLREIERPALRTVEIVDSQTLGSESATDAIPVSGPAEAESAPVPDTRANRPPGDRTEPRGEQGPGGDRDRRGRRSRRRTRGRGFPDTKYAQPGAIQQSPASRGAEEEEEGTSETPADVIILPGESLAKYRNVPPASVTASDTRPQLDAEKAPDFQSGDQEEKEEEELESRLEEIELSEAVFVHHPDPDLTSEPQIEGALEDALRIKRDEPAHSELPPEQKSEAAEAEFLAGDEAVTDELELRASVQHTASPALFLVRDELEAEPITIEPEPVSEPEMREDLAEPEPLVGTGPVDLEIEEMLEIRQELEHPETDELEESEQLFADSELPPEGPPQTGPSGPQTATVREDGRLMHRGSRRMRRRRGGNRSQTSQGDTVSPAVSGAAPALAKPELRTEPKGGESRSETREERPAAQPDRALPSITDLLKAGQEIIVQIAKEPLGQKGARITSHVALPGRYVVFMPSVNHLGVSRKVASDEERHRLKRILQAHRVGTTGGFIVRTAGEGVSEEEIAADMNFLYTLWLDIRQKAEKKPAPALLHYDLDIVQRILRDQVTDEFKAIWVDSEEMYESVLRFMQRFQPGLVNRVKMYTRPAPIFDAFNITQELEKALRPKVWLKSGGYIVINQTEALVAIDINTGKYVGKSNRLEDTIVKTNVEAVKEIVRQIRLRDLGGIIVVDFIDMDERKNRQKVMQALEEAMRADKAPYKILQFNDFGLVAITRKRVKQSLERTLCSPCPYCEGAGYVKSVQTVVTEILVEAQKIARAIEGKDVVLRVHPEVAKILKANSNQYLEELEEILKRPVLVTGDASLHHEKFDLG
ncbi:MAG TPA: Rne/Rng family ribonuclease [Bryobacteraceae bacterium]|jgi:ribonuclease G|nr:Rne/Rng family ribonuclease [Bryobacteraceae bacterium]